MDLGVGFVKRESLRGELGENWRVWWQREVVGERIGMEEVVAAAMAMAYPFVYERERRRRRKSKAGEFWISLAKVSVMGVGEGSVRGTFFTNPSNCTKPPSITVQTNYTD